ATAIHNAPPTTNSPAASPVLASSTSITAPPTRTRSPRTETADSTKRAARERSGKCSPSTASNAFASSSATIGRTGSAYLISTHPPILKIAASAMHHPASSLIEVGHDLTRGDNTARGKQSRRRNGGNRNEATLAIK